MGERKWTPGPWQVCNTYHAVHGERVRNIALCDNAHIPQGNGRILVSDDEATANAYLIAAAPDLYEACEAALHALAVAKDRATVLGDTLRNMGAPDQNRLQFETLMNRTADRIETALRKARGEQQ